MNDKKTIYFAGNFNLPNKRGNFSNGFFAMEIIDELEPNKRGPYAGAVGYIDFCGSMDTCIALRTIVITKGNAYVQSGAGIVADSQPEKEFEETLNKAKGLLVAIEMTKQRLNDNGIQNAGKP